MPKFLQRFKPVEHNFELPLFVTIFTVAFLVAAPDARWSRYASIFLLATSILLSLHASEVVRGRRHVAMVVIAIGVALAAYGNSVSGAHNIRGVGELIVVFPLILAATRVVMWIGRQRVITGQAVIGGLLVYLLIGLMFGQIYGGIIDLSDIQFFCQHATTSASDRVYFSFITITTTGYGDFTPCTRIGHSFAMAEAMFGQIYLVTIIALLIGNIGRERMPRDEVEAKAKAAATKSDSPS